MFLIDIPFKGCQGRSNRSSILHAVSYFAYGFNDTAYIFNFFAYHRCFAYDFDFSKLFEQFFVHAVSMILKKSNIFANSNLYSKRL
jgi:hypothetical protein